MPPPFALTAAITTSLSLVNGPTNCIAFPDLLDETAIMANSLFV